MPNSDQIAHPGSPKKFGEPTPRTSSGGGVVKVVVVLLVLVGAGVWWMQSHKTAAAPKASPFARGETPPVPVVDGVVARKDVPIYLEGLGTVQAYNTVTIRSRVDGQLKNVSFTEGQDVHAGDLLAQIDPDAFQAQVDQAIAKRGQDEALLANAQVDLRRYEDLLKTEGVTQQVYDTQKALVNQLEATIKADQAAIDNAKVQLNYTRIVSPIDGRVGVRQVDQGNIVHANDSNGLVVITQLKPISVLFTLNQKDFESVQAQVAKSGSDFSVIAVGQDNTTVLDEGKLAVIDNQIDTTTATVKIKATFPNHDLRLWPGQFVNARLLLTTRKDSAVVPSSVIQRGPEGPLASFVFVIKEDQTVEMRPVKVALITKGEAVVEEGLEPGERVVVDGQYKLQKGSRVRLADAPGGGGGRPSGAGPGGKPGGGKPSAPGEKGSREYPKKANS